MSANDDNQVLSLSRARKSDDMVGVFAQYFEWNISAALEKIGESPAQAEKALQQQQRAENVHRKKWERTMLFTSHLEMLRAVAAEPNVVVLIGVPPSVHGDSNHALELDCVRAGVRGVFVEKPISCAPPTSASVRSAPSKRA